MLARQRSRAATSEQHTGTKTNWPMPGCPFYGFRWPEHSSTLRRAGGNECGLDIDTNGRCRMETSGLVVNYFVCPMVERYGTVLDASKHVIRFDRGEGAPQNLAAWEREHRP